MGCRGAPRFTGFTGGRGGGERSLERRRAQLGEPRPDAQGQGWGALAWLGVSLPACCGLKLLVLLGFTGTLAGRVPAAAWIVMAAGLGLASAWSARRRSAQPAESGEG